MKTNYVKKLFLFVISGFVFGLLPVSKAIGADLLEPQITIQTASNKLKERLQDEDFNKDFAQINLFVEEVIGPAIDFNRISALVLGKLWKTATKEEKLRFRKEFKALLIRTYSRAFIEFTDWSVRYLPYKLNEGEKKVVVKTQILQPGRRPLSVN
jgi:phospholipid transport system substrate-binding protein